MIIRYGISGVLLFFMILFLSLEAAGQDNFGKIKCVCIDAGHGGSDPGAVGLVSYEKNITLPVALKVGKMIKEQYPGIKIVYTRDKDVAVDLKIRTKIANDSKADLFMSIHANSFKNKTVKGIETYVLGSNNSEQNLRVAMKENSVIRYEEDYTVKYAGFDPARAESYIIFSLIQNVHLGNSLEIASIVQKELVKGTRKLDRDVRQAPLWVLKDASMPATLIEVGYISNAEEERFMNTTEGQQQIASSIFVAFEKYKNSVEKNSSLLTKKEKKEEIIAEEEVKKATGELFYAVQIASAANKIKNLSDFQITEQVKELQSGNRYRYYIGESVTYDEVKLHHNRIKKSILDCFIIAVYKGELLSIDEAKKIERKQK